MAIHCPLCSEEIAQLSVYQKCERKFNLVLEAGEINWYEEDVYNDASASIDFECPSCGGLLFNDEAQATKFLSWGDLYPWKGVDNHGQDQQGSTADGDSVLLEQGPGPQAGQDTEG